MTAARMWMVRAGEGGWRFAEFERDGVVSVGWSEIGDPGTLRGRDDFVRQAARVCPEIRKAALHAAAGQFFRFVQEMKPGDAVLTYDPAARVYLVGSVTGECEYAPAVASDQPNRRGVCWRGRVARDGLSVATRNSLGAISTLFVVPPEAATGIERALAAAPVVAPVERVPVEPEVDDLYKDIQARAFEFTKDKVSRLDSDDMQELVAGLLRAMGYKTRVSPSGSDRGKDIVASPDGLGFEDPRIVVEVQHRTATPIVAQDIRAFLGGRHESDKGLYVGHRRLHEGGAPRGPSVPAYRSR